MRGQVIDGLHKGCPVIQTQDNQLFIRDSQGRTVPVNPDTALSVTDISHNYPGFGAKTYMVRWKQDAGSVLQLFPDAEPVAAAEQRSTGKKLPVILAFLAVVLALSLALVGWHLGLFHRHSWAEATCDAPRTCTGCGETEGEALTHEPGEWTVTKRAGYGSWGARTQRCSLCDVELAQDRYLADAYTDGLYRCSIDEFHMRVKLWLEEAGLDADAQMIDEEGELAAIRIGGSRSSYGVVCFVDQDFYSIQGEVSGRLNASSVCIAFDKGNAVWENKLLPVMIACCNNGMDLTQAETLMTEIKSRGKYEHDGVRYLWGSSEGLDYLFLGFDSVPESIRNLPEVRETQQWPDSILYDSTGSFRDTASFVDAYEQQAGEILRENGYGEFEVVASIGSGDLTYGIREPGSSEYSVLTFTNEDEFLQTDGAFTEIYLLSPMESETQVEAFVVHSAAMIHLVDPSMGNFNECGAFLNRLLGQMENKSVQRTMNGIDYYVVIRDDGYITLVIDFQ